MAELLAQSAFGDLLPLSAEGITIREVQLSAITSVAPFKGQGEAVSDALLSAVGAPFPAPSRFETSEDTIVTWSALDQAFVLGPPPGHIPGAAITDQTGAWAVADMEGPLARAVLERLMPIDLRDNAFGVGQAARAPLAHMSSLILRLGPEHYRVLVFRSMAGSAAHDLSRAMRMVTARAAL